MADDKFEVSADTARGLLRITLRGLWNADDVRRYRSLLARMSEQLRAAGCPRGNTIVLVDARALGPQSQDMVAHYKASMGGDDMAVRRLATIVTSALFRRQVERIAIANQRVFNDESGALAWLLSSEDAP